MEGGGQSPPKIINRVCSYLMALLSGNWRNSKAGQGFAVRQGSLVLHSVNKGPGVVMAHWTFCRKEWTLKVTDLTGQGVIITQTGLICAWEGVLAPKEAEGFFTLPCFGYCGVVRSAEQALYHLQLGGCGLPISGISTGSLSEMQMKDHCIANQNSNGRGLQMS